MPFGEENIISLPLFFCHTKCYTRHNESPQFCPVFHAFGSPAKPRLKGNMYMENEYIIEMLNITKEFPGIKANDNITLQLKKGEIHALLGENGAGKSTTMNILTGYLSSTEGEAKINGIDILEEPVKAKQMIGYLPEQPPLYLDMTVMEYLKFVYGLKKCKLPINSHLKEIRNLSLIHI